MGVSPDKQMRIDEVQALLDAIPTPIATPDPKLQPSFTGHQLAGR
jgi:hypothetical protein